MPVHKHEFTSTIVDILDRHANDGMQLLEANDLLQYLNLKTRAANRGSKSRAGYANLYAIYVLIEDYINGNFDKSGSYKDYEGARFSDLLNRQRQMPFGSRLQNHALNHRLNEEFKRYFPTSGMPPIIRDSETNRYWINEKMIYIDGTCLAAPIIDIIDAYIAARQSAFNDFLEFSEGILKAEEESPEKIAKFIRDLLTPNVDARIFEIVSYSILKHHYGEQTMYWGWSSDALTEEAPLALFKTGRTNANDGGIDFVMQPLGRFFQVTETVDVGKYFLDIDKVLRYPITFVVKSNNSEEDIMAAIATQAEEKYQIRSIVEKYKDSIEEIINVPRLEEMFEQIVVSGKGAKVVAEIVLQSRVEFDVDIEDHEDSDNGIED